MATVLIIIIHMNANYMSLSRINNLVALLLDPAKPARVTPPDDVLISVSHSNGHLEELTGHRTAPRAPPLHPPLPAPCCRQFKPINRSRDRSTVMSTAVDRNRRVACGRIKATGAVNDISAWQSRSSPLSWSIILSGQLISLLQHQSEPDPVFDQLIRFKSC